MQCIQDLRIKLQKLQLPDPGVTLDVVIQVVTNSFYNRERERMAKAQEKERKKELRHINDFSPSGTPHKLPLKPLKVNLMGKAGFANSQGTGPKNV